MLLHRAGLTASAGLSCLFYFIVDAVCCMYKVLTRVLTTIPPNYFTEQLYLLGVFMQCRNSLLYCIAYTICLQINTISCILFVLAFIWLISWMLNIIALHMSVSVINKHGIADE